MKGTACPYSGQNLTSECLYRTLKEELTKLTQLKKQSLIRKVAVYEEDKRQIAEIFERVNQAREQLVVRICMTIYVSLLLPLFSW